MSTKPHSHIKHLGVDAGGTFTDFVLIDENEQMRTHKVLSTPDNPALAIMQGIKDLALESALTEGQLLMVHGSTVATNAALEGKGAKTAYIANKGFKDVLTIGRQARKELYNLKPAKVAPPVPSELCFEINCRRDAQGALVAPLKESDIDALVTHIKLSGAEAVAINLLFSFLNEDEEKRIEQALPNSLFCSRSSFVLPVYKEYERGMATWLNASLGPKVNQYLNTLQTELSGCEVSIMQSSGGLLSLDDAKIRAVNLLLSGPAGGLSAVRLLGKTLNKDKILSFDMGGTSTDVSLMNGDFKLTNEGRIADWPVAVPMLDMETIGAGGGSIAWIDEAGMLHVGPESAGSSPGPACYGQGGSKATVTDANLVLGHLPKNAQLGGSLQLDYEAAEHAIQALGEQLGLSTQATAEGIIQLAEQQMISALHNISVKQGYSPADFTLCCFGGAGGLHVCALAEKLKVKEALIPQNAGVLSAFGMLTAPPLRNATKSIIKPWLNISPQQIDEVFSELLLDLRNDNPELVEHGKISKHLDLRYLGQSYTIEVDYCDDSAERFVQAHKQRFGHTLNKALELVNVKLMVSGKANIETWNEHTETDMLANPTIGAHKRQTSTETPIYIRDALQSGEVITGPAIIAEAVSTTWLPCGWACQVDRYGNLVLNQSDEAIRSRLDS